MSISREYKDNEGILAYLKNGFLEIFLSCHVNSGSLVDPQILIHDML